jgi:signal transduction histidine kinase
VTLRQRFTWGYGTIMLACFFLVIGLAHHEFVTEAKVRRQLGTKESQESAWGDAVEVLCYCVIPVVLAAGWWLMRRTLQPIDELTRAVARLQAETLSEPLPRTENGDEIDQLAAAFNAMRERLDQSFRQVQEFTLHASHELKTPLTVMRGELEIAIQHEDTFTPPQRDCLHSMIDEVERLTQIVDALTLLTKADAGELRLERKPVRLAELVQESYEDALILAEPEGLKVTLGECADLTVVGDRHRLRQLLLNLTDNAVKYNQPSGVVSMALRQRDGAAEIEITNTSEGIPPELQPKIFDRFVRGENARAKSIDGSGVGLTIAQWIAQAHHGAIKLSSEPGKTTTALVHLPLAGS